MRKLAGSLGGCVAALMLAAGHARAATPWFERDACRDVLESVNANRFDEAENALGVLENRSDPDDRACAVYGRLFLAENYLSIHGDEPKWLANRDRHLKRMLIFAKTHAKFGARFADFEMEARMRRTRLLFDSGQQTEAVSEARRTNRLLKERLEDDDESATRSFVQGVMYTAFGQSNFLARTLFRLAGLGGSGDDGRASLIDLADGDTPYMGEALYLTLHFAMEDAREGKTESPFGDPAERARRLVERYPTNPQYVYEYVKVLQFQNRCAEAEAVLRSSLQAMNEDPRIWAPEMRAKLYYRAAECAIETQDVARATQYRDQLKAQARANFNDELADLDTQLASVVKPSADG